MADTRTVNTTRNIITGLINKIVSIILPFINRTIIIYVLGVQFTGISSLFKSILSVLSIAELGFNTAIIYSMYEPIAKGNKQEVCKLLTLYKRIYHYVGIIILIIGLGILPFIPTLVKDNIPINVYYLYFLYLLDTVISYFMFSYKESILLANQRQDISNNIRTKVLFVKYILQSIELILFKDFYIFLYINIISTVITNLLIAKETQKYFPEYECIKGEKIIISKEIKKNVGGLLVSKMCDRLRNSLDSIILSMFLGLTIVGIYNNYYYVYSSLYLIMLAICNSMSASVANSIVKETKKKNYNDLLKFSLMAAWLSGWMTICLICMYQPFMKLWVGENLLLSNFNMLLFCIYFYCINMNNIRNQYSRGNGLWWKTKHVFVMEAISNIVLNIILGKYLGITGIILSTIITIFVFNFLGTTKVLFKEYFKISMREFLLNHAYWILCFIIAAIPTIVISNLFKVEGVIKLIINLIICCIIPNIIILILFKNSKIYKEAKSFIMRFIKSRIKKENSKNV